MKKGKKGICHEELVFSVLLALMLELFSLTSSILIGQLKQTPVENCLKMFKICQKRNMKLKQGTLISVNDIIDRLIDRSVKTDIGREYSKDVRKVVETKASGFLPHSYYIFFD